MVAVAPIVPVPLLLKRVRIILVNITLCTSARLNVAPRLARYRSPQRIIIICMGFTSVEDIANRYGNMVFIFIPASKGILNVEYRGMFGIPVIIDNAIFFSILVFSVYHPANDIPTFS